MIRYALRCDRDHEFEAWFRSSADYDRAAEGGVTPARCAARPKSPRRSMAPAGQPRRPETTDGREGAARRSRSAPAGAVRAMRQGIPQEGRPRTPTMSATSSPRRRGRSTTRRPSRAASTARRRARRRRAGRGGRSSSRRCRRCPTTGTEGPPVARRRGLALAGILVALTLAAPAAGIVQDLYTATVFVTGQGEETRGPGLAKALAAVLVKVSGDPRLATDPRSRPSGEGSGFRRRLLLSRPDGGNPGPRRAGLARPALRPHRRPSGRPQSTPRSRRSAAHHGRPAAGAAGRRPVRNRSTGVHARRRRRKRPRHARGDGRRSGAIRHAGDAADRGVLTTAAFTASNPGGLNPACSTR